jgi:hypothetical protein
MPVTSHNMHQKQSKTRAIRFSQVEELEIQEFLAANPFFDFSTLARAAIREFVRKPQMRIKPIQSKEGQKEIAIGEN